MGNNIPVAAIKLQAVKRCALSAHTRPCNIILSNVETFASLALWAAARNRWTFCCGVSPSGAGARSFAALEDMFAADGGFENA